MYSLTSELLNILIRLLLLASSFLVYWNSIFIRLNSLSLSATQPSWTSCFYQTWSWPSRFPPWSCWWRLHSSWSFLMPDLNWSWPMQLFFLKKYGRAIQDNGEYVNDHIVLKYILYQLSYILPPSSHIWLCPRQLFFLKKYSGSIQDMG